MLKSFHLFFLYFYIATKIVVKANDYRSMDVVNVC